MILRQFITIEDGIWGTRQVHYQTAGAGPCLLLLHQAPLSANEMAPLIDRWSKHFTCIAPDHPGFGLSDPSGKDQVSIQELATALLEVLDALGIEQTAVYGVHTGACMGVALAAAAPNRIWACVANGYVMVTPEEREDLLVNYLPELELTADGSHLSWLWWRVREKSNFAPWYRSQASNRIKNVKPALPQLHEVVLEMLRSEDQYRTGYRAAFTFDGQSLLDRVATPTLVIAAKQDSLAGHLQRIKKNSQYIESKLSINEQQARQTSLSFLQAQAKSQVPIQITPATKPIQQVLSNQMFFNDGQQIRIQSNLSAPGRPVLIIHDSIGSVDVASSISNTFINRRPVICLDLPGHGESDGETMSDEHYVANCLSSILSTLDLLLINDFDCVGLGSGSHLAIELQKRVPKRLSRIAMIDPVCLHVEEKIRHLKAENPNWQPRWDGGHLMELWYRMRDEALFWPWFEPDKGAPIYQTPWLDNNHLQKRLVAFLKAPGRTYQSIHYHARYPLIKALTNSDQQWIMCAAKWSPHYADAKLESGKHKNLMFLELPSDPCRWGKVLCREFDE